MNDLYRSELRLFQNLFLPSVKLAQKERVGSRLRRHYEAVQTPFQRVAASPGADPERVAELRGQRRRLDSFQLSARVQAKLQGIFGLSAEAPANALPRPDGQPAPVRALDRAKGGGHEKAGGRALVGQGSVSGPAAGRGKRRVRGEKQPPGSSLWK
jgi:hypothetical protein